MRRQFARSLLRRAIADERIFLLTGDLGYKMWDEYGALLPERFVNVGAAEQALLDVAVGLATAGKIPVCYSITPFLIYRPLETIRTYLLKENHHVVLAGSGRYSDYGHDGYSHDASDAFYILNHIHMKLYIPNTREEVPTMLDEALAYDGPSFVSLRR